MYDSLYQSGNNWGNAIGLKIDDERQSLKLCIQLLTKYFKLVIESD